MGLFMLARFLVATVPAMIVLRKQGFKYAVSTSLIGVLIGTPLWISCWFLARFVPFPAREVGLYVSMLGGLVVANYIVKYVVSKRTNLDKR